MMNRIDKDRGTDVIYTLTVLKNVKMIARTEFEGFYALQTISAAYIYFQLVIQVRITEIC